jgi:hypothetical protein
MLNGTFILSQMQVNGSWGGGGLYQGTPFEITYGISVLRLSWVQHNDGGIHRGTVLGFDCINII